MKRLANVILRFTVVLDDDKEGVPCGTGVVDAILSGAARAIPGCTMYLPGGTVEIGLDRASIQALRKRKREMQIVASGGPWPKRAAAAAPRGKRNQP